MVDPINITDYYRDDKALQELLIFSILVAGKNALTTSKLLDVFIRDFNYGNDTPFETFRRFQLNSVPTLPGALKQYGFGCYNSKAKGIYQLVRANLDLRKCTVAELEKIHNIGKKTSRLFVLHSRFDAKCIPLDVHILHQLRDFGHDVPKSTPGSNKKYLEIENICLKYVKKSGLTCAEWDLQTWRKYSGNSMKIAI